MSGIFRLAHYVALPLGAVDVCAGAIIGDWFLFALGVLLLIIWAVDEAS